MHWSSLIVGILIGWLILPMLMRTLSPAKSSGA